MAIKMLKVRIKDKHVKHLRKMSKSVNLVWNYINDLSHQNIKRRGKFLSAYDIQKYTAGCAKELGKHSQTLQRVGAEYVTRRKQFGKNRLQWRTQYGARRSLGWIPVNGQSIFWKKGCIYHNETYFQCWDSWDLSQYKFKSASFNEDSRGRWYVNVSVEVEKTTCGSGSVGIDLGCKDAATTSDGDKLRSREYRALEAKLGIAQRARKKERVRAIHAKIKNRRKDKMYKFTTKLVRKNALVVVGNVSSSKLVKTKMAKSVLDAGWYAMKTALKYKCDHAGAVFLEVNENYTTQTCSSCGVIPQSSPKGRTGLGIREWICSECGTVHDRDTNAAKNILAFGHERLAGGITAPSGR